MDKLKPIQFPFTCRCGVRHAKLATARWDKVDRLHYDCATCRPRPAKAQGIFRDHNCTYCGDGAKPCRQGSPNQCEYPHAKND